MTAETKQEVLEEGESMDVYHYLVCIFAAAEAGLFYGVSL